MQNMLNSEFTIAQPAYEYISEQAVADSLAYHSRKQEEREGKRHVPIKYHNKNQTQEELEEFAIAGAFEEAKNLKDLGKMLRDGQMKEFY